MAPLPRILAVALLLCGAAPPPASAPLAPIDPAVWNELADWQRSYYNDSLADPAWRRKRGLAENAWSGMPLAERGRLVLDALKEETGRRLGEEVFPLYSEERSWQADPALPTREDKEVLIDKVLSWKARFPHARMDPRLAQARDDLRRRALYYQQELTYREAHPKQVAAAQTLQTLAKTRTAIQPGAEKEALDRLYDNAPGARAGGPGPARSTDAQGRGERSRTTGVRGEAGAKTLPAAGTRQGKRIDAAVPLPLHWKYVHQPPEGLSEERMAWRKKVDADAKEQRFLEVVLGTLDAPVEREVLGRVAREQALVEAERTRSIPIAERTVAALEVDLRDAGLSRETKARLKEELAHARKTLADHKAFSTELTVSMGDLPEDLTATTYIDEQPGPDGRKRVRVVFNRDLAFPRSVKLDNPKDATRKIAAHEMTHVADFYAGARDAGPSQRYVEPRGFVTAALSYKQEGEPQGRMVEVYAADDYRWLTADPAAWIFRQVNGYVSEAGYEGPAGLWENLSPDDYADPRKALDWRLQFAYRYVTSGGRPSEGETRAARLRRLGTAFTLPPGQQDLVVRLDADRTVPEREKAAVFARTAAADPKWTAWMSTLRTAPMEVVQKTAREEKEFFDSLRPLFK